MKSVWEETALAEQMRRDIPSKIQMKRSDEAYQNMAKDRGRESQALEWAEGTLGDAQ